MSGHDCCKEEIKKRKNVNIFRRKPISCRFVQTDRIARAYVSIYKSVYLHMCRRVDGRTTTAWNEHLRQNVTVAIIYHVVLFYRFVFSERPVLTDLYVSFLFQNTGSAPRLQNTVSVSPVVCVHTNYYHRRRCHYRHRYYYHRRGNIIKRDYNGSPTRHTHTHTRILCAPVERTGARFIRDRENCAKRRHNMDCSRSKPI